MIVKNNSGINQLSDFKNKRIYIGNKGSGSRVMIDKLFAKNGWKGEDFKEVHEEQLEQIYSLFCNNKIDAAIYLVGHPNLIFGKTLAKCGVKLISFSRKEIESYADIFRHVYPSIIKKRTYNTQKSDINTVASQLLLAASDKLDEETVYNFVQIISDHYSEIQNKNPNLQGASLFGSEINGIALHKGVVRFYRNSRH
jgi:TRAP transporter TAXI family solute receptor